MRHLELALIASLAAASVSCVSTINGYASAGDESNNVKGELGADDAGAPPEETADASNMVPPQPEAAGAAAPAPDAGKPPAQASPMDAGSMPPMAAMPAAGSASMPPAAGSASPPPPPADAGAACDFRGLLQSKCGSSGCHGAPATSTGLDLTSPSLATRVAGRKGPSACSSNLLVDPANPSKSALYLKVTGTTCGSQMPLGGKLTPSEQACILSWIEAL